MTTSRNTEKKSEPRFFSTAYRFGNFFSFVVSKPKKPELEAKCMSEFSNTESENYYCEGLKILMQHCAEYFKQTSFLEMDDWHRLMDKFGGDQIFQTALADVFNHFSSAKKNDYAALVKLAFFLHLNIINFPNDKTDSLIKFLKTLVASNSMHDMRYSAEDHLKMAELTQAWGTHLQDRVLFVVSHVNYSSSKTRSPDLLQKAKSLMEWAQQECVEQEMQVVSKKSIKL